MDYQQLRHDLEGLYITVPTLFNDDRDLSINGEGIRSHVRFLRENGIGRDNAVLLAGGGFRHGQHLAFNRPYVQSLASADDVSLKQEKQKKAAPQMGVNQAPLCNLFASMLQQAGVERDRFSSGSGTLNGLKPA